MPNSALFRRFSALFLCGFSGCVGACARPADTYADAQLAASAPTSTAPTPSTARVLGRSSGDNPFGFLSGPSSARPGDYALVPSKSSLDRAFDEVSTGRGLFYSGAWIELSLEKETRVRWLTQQSGSVPNALVISIRPREAAQPGDVVLTSGPGGTGLLRAFVVGGSPDSPKVLPLDAAPGDSNLPTSEQAILPKRTFNVLRNPGDVGTSIACRSGDRLQGLILLSRYEDRLLGLGFAGTTEAFPASRCRLLPPSTKLAAGDRVFVRQLERLVEARVESVRTETGRVSVKFTFAGEERTVEVGLLNVATELP